LPCRHNYSEAPAIKVGSENYGLKWFEPIKQKSWFKWNRSHPLDWLR
jgi:hypothetical protein